MGTFERNMGTFEVYVKDTWAPLKYFTTMKHQKLIWQYTVMMQKRSGPDWSGIACGCDSRCGAVQAMGP